MGKPTYFDEIKSFDEKQMAQFINKIYLCGEKGATEKCGKCGLFLCCPSEIVEENLKMDAYFDLITGGVR